LIIFSLSLKLPADKGEILGTNAIILNRPKKKFLKKKAIKNFRNALLHDLHNIIPLRKAILHRIISYVYYQIHGNNKMKYLFLSFLIFCFVSLNAQENQKYININGTSELILPADQINFTIQIKVLDDSIEESKKTNDGYLNELMTILKSNGINSNDISVSPITLGKNYEYDINRERKQKGFFTEIKITFLLKDLSKYFGLTNNISSSNHFEIFASSYSISDYEQQHKTAYINALTAAKEKAEYMTKTLGVKLGEVLEIDENNSLQGYPNPFNSVTQVNSQDGSISGKVALRRSVRVKFAIN
jgi:uncharacterized protein